MWGNHNYLTKTSRKKSFVAHHEIQGVVEDCCCDYATMDALNQEFLHGILQKIMNIRFFCYFKVLCTLITISFVYLFQCYNMCVDGLYKLYHFQETSGVVGFHYCCFLSTLQNVSHTFVFSFSFVHELKYLTTTSTLLMFVIICQVVWET